LLVDDDPDIRETVADLLRGEGYVVTTAEDGQVALGLLRAASFDLLISDLHMPRLDGAALLKRAAQEGLLSNTEVLLATARPQEAAKFPVKVLPKPVELDVLLAEVGKRLGRRG
jgi:CheY-like chemotaxis protein